MTRPADIRRAIVVVLDGLRPDAISAFDLPNIARLAAMGASTLSGSTVTPSLTWPALTSLLCGIPPAEHGILADSIHLPKPKQKLAPLPELLASHGYPSAAFMESIPTLYRGTANRIARGLGFAEARFAGEQATAVMMSAQSTLRSRRRGLIFMHWADADRAGHEHGWMSGPYGEATRRMDAALGTLIAATDVHDDPHTLLVALADHGGGGVHPRHHEDSHPMNATIPIILAGGTVRTCAVDGASLLDIPPTVAWALGVAPPPRWAGRPLTEAFGRADVPEPGVAVA